MSDEERTNDLGVPASDKAEKKTELFHDHGHRAHDHHVEIPDDDDEAIMRAFRWGVGLNFAIVGAEVIFGLMSNSIGLLSDAGHNFSDVMSIVLAWWAHMLAKKKPSGRMTFGYRRVSIMTALASAILLLVVTGGLMWEAIGRFSQPQKVNGWMVLVVAAIGVGINSYTAFLFMKSSKDDLNVRGAFLHLASDAVVSVGVMASGLLIILFGWDWTDPLISLCIGVVLLVAAWGLLKEATLAVLDAAPSSIDVDEVQSYLEKREGITGVHDLHVWSLSTREIALSAHLVMPGDRPTDRDLADLATALRKQFGVKHVTMQVEQGDPQVAPSLCNPQCDPKERKSDSR